jgi:hypothetical protein
MDAVGEQLPAWAREMRDLFISGSTCQFILHGNIFDVIPGLHVATDATMETTARPGARPSSLQEFLESVMFASYDVILHYDRGRGIRATRGADDFGRWLDETYGSEGTKLARIRESGPALELIDRYLLRTLHFQAIGKGQNVPRRIAVIIDFAEFVVPRGNSLQMGGEFSSNVVKILGWANDPAILRSNIATVLVTEGLHDLNELVVQNPHAAKLHLSLPNESDMQYYVQSLIQSQFPDLPDNCDVPIDVLTRRLTGLSHVGARTTIALALKNNRKITSVWLSRTKKDMIERECQGLLEFLESPFTLDHVAGHEAVKEWLRQDTQLLKRGALHALPMGYLITGRIGTGKTFIVQCWAGELGIPCVVFKNFRDRWVGATESNLEKIFSILRALGQVLVFVDEADQATGRRGGSDSDGGLSGRVYGMLAKEMSETRNRGRIIWVFATSRPDLLEVDLKRQGRLDIHIPLFPPQNEQEMGELLLIMAKKLKFPLTGQDLPRFPKGLVLGGNEIEGVLVRALRIHELAAAPRPALREVLAAVIAEVRPNSHTRKLEYMDLIAVKECTDLRFLPARYRDLTPEDLEQRIADLNRFV